MMESQRKKVNYDQSIAVAAAIKKYFTLKYPLHELQFNDIYNHNLC